jgi:hypothetical protein
VGTFKSLLVLAFVASLAACGGGDTTTTIPLSLAECFQIDTQKAHQISVTHSPANFQTGLNSGVSTGGAGSAIDPVTGLPVSSSIGTSTTSSYADSRYDTNYRTAIYKAAPATVRNRSGVVFVAGTASSLPIAFNNDYFFAISSTGMAYLGSVFLGTQGAVISEMEDASINFLPGQGLNQSTVSTFTSTVSAGTITKTITYVAQEDVITSVGTFKNSCKLDFEEKTTSSVIDSSHTSKRSTIWVSPGWGVVKEVSTHSFSDGRLPSSVIRNRQVTAILKGSL